MKTEALFNETTSQVNYMRDPDQLDIDEVECPYAEEDDWEDLCGPENFFGQLNVEPLDTVVLAKPTNENAYPDAYIVLEKESGTTNHALYRYWLNASGKIVFELIFKIRDSDITDLFLFEDHALVYISDHYLATVFFSQFRDDDDIPRNYIVDLLGDVWHNNDETISALEVTRDGANIEVFVALKQNSITLYRMRLLTNSKAVTASLEQVGSTLGFLNTLQISSLTIMDELLVLQGCRDCKST